MVELVYFASGLILPAFYVPQIFRLLRDNTGLAGYSLGKSTSQFVLRWPALWFAIWVVRNDLMVLVVSLDALGRTLELAAAIWSLRRQGHSILAVGKRWFFSVWFFRPSRIGWRKYIAVILSMGMFSAFVSHALADKREQIALKALPHATNTDSDQSSTGGFLDSQ